MAGPKVSKVSEEDARLWLSSLQQVGEGWYKQVGLAVKANAHKALGMERREFVAQVGQRLIDPREAIIELHREDMTVAAIADVLGVGHHTVTRVLVEEGEIESRELSAGGGREAARRRDASGENAAPSRDSVDSTAEEVDDEIEALEAALAEAQEEARDAQAAAKGEIKRRTAELRKQLAEAKQENDRLRHAEMERQREEMRKRQEEEAPTDADRRRRRQRRRRTWLRSRRRSPSGPRSP
jgi:chromosome segregation ATPase